MENDEKGKLFVGGLSWETSQESLMRYFQRFGAVSDCVVVKNNETGRSRGFGFVTYLDENNVGLVLQNAPHHLDGRTIDPKFCKPRKVPRQATRPGVYPKVFLGGLPSSVTETDLRQVFGRYGNVMEVTIMYDQGNRKSRGFGFLTFDNESSVDRVTSEQYIYLKGRKIEIKKAEPRGSVSGNETPSQAGFYQHQHSQMNQEPTVLQQPHQPQNTPQFHQESGLLPHIIREANTQFIQSTHQPSSSSWSPIPSPPPIQQQQQQQQQEHHQTEPIQSEADPHIGVAQTSSYGTASRNSYTASAAASSTGSYDSWGAPNVVLPSVDNEPGVASAPWTSFNSSSTDSSTFGGLDNGVAASFSGARGWNNWYISPLHNSRDEAFTRSGGTVGSCSTSETFDQVLADIVSSAGNVPSPSASAFNAVTSTVGELTLSPYPSSAPATDTLPFGKYSD